MFAWWDVWTGVINRNHIVSCVRTTRAIVCPCVLRMVLGLTHTPVPLMWYPIQQELKEKHRDVMQDVLMDILRALSSPNMDIRKKTLDIAMDLVTSRNIDEVGKAGRGG